MMQFVQQSFFGDSDMRMASRSRHLPDWSPSKRGHLFQCPRRYYYEYYSKFLQIPRDQTASLLFYKKLSNSWMLAGILLHLKIREAFGIWRQGATIESNSFVRDIAQWWDRARQSSVQFARSPDYSKPHSKVLLMEFVFEDSDANKTWWEAGQRLEKALLGFLTLSSLERFRIGGLTPDAAIEKRVKVEGQGFRMRGQIDLAWREGSRIAVADWKSGSRDSADSDLQMLAYSLAVKEHFNCALSDVDPFRVELGNGKVIPLTVNEQDAARAKARIAQDTAIMVGLHNYGERGIAEAFTPTGSPKICRLCPYQRVCPGSEV